ncbi:SIR2 family NAD-dependent protein deacylase [Afifella sp. YEN Y35]|uniref:SIR2 family NAD-dependent protein deacylase n=1 Tax=Afifella sp. YEN Y35 TaxID=3388337 RepID=UPI0039E07327
MSAAAALDEVVVRNAEPILDDIVRRLKGGGLIPYLGPGVLPADAGVPTSYAALAEFFSAKVALPRRARGNPWASAQFIEGRKHRKTLDALMAAAFAEPVAPTPLHEALASCSQIPMIVDSWYDGAMRSALAQRRNRSAGQGPERAADWGEVQGITRAGIGEFLWFRFYDAEGGEVSAPQDEWRTLLYKPHGGVAPAHNYLIADSDYVEVLTEIDIQTPIPEIVRARRTNCGFLFVGCRFDDQMLRLYARQIMKRSKGPCFALVEPDGLTRNELRFFETEAITPLAASPARLAARLAELA